MADLGTVIRPTHDTYDMVGVLGLLSKASCFFPVISSSHSEEQLEIPQVTISGRTYMGFRAIGKMFSIPKSFTTI